MENTQTKPSSNEVAEVVKAFVKLPKIDKKGVIAFGLGLMTGLELAKKPA